jgi:putative membrane-bound dehydrogenase-like protein
MSAPPEILMRFRLLVGLLLAPVLSLAAELQVGVAKVDITPSTPIRLTGYAARKTESEGVEHRLFARALAIGTGKGDACVLVTLDTMAMPREVVEEVARRLKEKAGLARERLAVCATHTHAAPMIAGAAPNIFGQEIPADQMERINRYTTEVTDNLEKVALAALADLKPATVSIARGEVGFAANRRTRVGPNLPAPVDHELPVVIVKGGDGAVRAVVANYACHCTTGGSEINKVHGDWAGYASENLEAAWPGAVGMITIGCGADANPAPRGNLDLARQHGAALASEVARLVKEDKVKPLTTPPVGQIKVIDAPFDKLPTKEELETLARENTPRGYNAKVQLARLAKDGKLPEVLPYTVQTWRFGEDLAMVFLAGEVVVDYALRLKHEFEPSKLWVSSYANDVCCYIPSRRILAEGGYEAVDAMVYYGRPTKFAPAIENDIVRAVHSLLPLGFRSEKSLKEFPPGKSAEESKQCIKVDGELRVELVAAEPLVQSPVAIDWDLKGRLWVLEMYDYPSGLHDDNRPGGRVVLLESSKGDGRYDKRTVFLDGLAYPQGLMCWRSGVLVCAAPDILYAADDDHDGRADSRKVLFSGFNPDNQQWEVNGLSWGLDNWVYGASSIRNDPIRMADGKAPLELGGRDFRMNPDTGAFEPAAGRTQFCRVRDDFGNWFGNDNSNPLYHYPLEERYVRRNPNVTYPSPKVSVVADKDPTRLYPISRLLERFNNPESANRVTSACGPSIYRDSLLFGDRGERLDAFFCEPVHNLVRRVVLTPKGATFEGHRSPADEREFLASTDNWFRPVQTRTGPDGALWIVDMYRFVIEHPRWITAERLKTLDTRAGHDMGRIYRVVPRDARARAVEDLSTLSAEQFAAKLDHPNGVVRDLIHRELVHRKDNAAVIPLRTVVRGGRTPAARAQALWALLALNPLEVEALHTALVDADARVRRQSIRVADSLVSFVPFLGDRLIEMAHDADPAVRYQLALTIGEANGPGVPAALAELLTASPDDLWMGAAVLSASAKCPVELLERLRKSPTAETVAVRSQLALTVASTGAPEHLGRALSLVLPEDASFATVSDFELTASVLDTIERRKLTVAELPGDAAEKLRAVSSHARVIARDDVSRADARFVAALALLGRAPGDEADVEIAGKLLNALSVPRVQTAALGVLRRSRDPRAAEGLVAALPRVSPSLREQVFQALTARTGLAEALLNAVETGAVARADIPAAIREKLMNHRNSALRERAAKSLAVSPTPARAKALAEFQPTLKLTGDPGRGRALFEKSCAACHALGGLGYPVGPDLTALTDKSAGYLLTAIVDPNAAVEGRFVAYQVETSDGDTHVGLLTDENAASLTLIQPNGLRQMIRRNDIKSLSTTKLSLMPEGLEQGLTPQDLADLIAFVQRPTAR